MQTSTIPHLSENSFGNVLLSGNTKGHSLFIQVWIIYLGLGGFISGMPLLGAYFFPDAVIELGNFGLSVPVVLYILAAIVPFFCLLIATTNITTTSVATAGNTTASRGCNKCYACVMPTTIR